MPTSAVISLLLSGLLLCYAPGARAQEPLITIQAWGVEEGLSDRQVNALCKDDRGFIWLGTQKGLNRFDGRKFISFTKSRDGLPFSDIEGIVRDASGYFWMMGSDFYDARDLKIFLFEPLTQRVVKLEERTGLRGAYRVNFLQKFSDSVLLFGHAEDPYFYTWSERSGLKKTAYPVQLKLLVTITDRNSFWVVDATNDLCEISPDGRLLRRCRTGDATRQHLGPLAKQSQVYRPMSGQRFTQQLVTDVVVQGDSAALRHPHALYAWPDVPIQYGSGALPLADVIARLKPEQQSLLPQIMLEDEGVIWLCSAFGLVRVVVAEARFRRYFHKEEGVLNNSYRNLIVMSGTLYGVLEGKGVMEAALNPARAENSFGFPIHSTGFYSLNKTRDGRLLGLRSVDVYWKDGVRWQAAPLVKNYNARAVDEWQDVVTVWKVAGAGPDSFLLGTSAGLRHFNFATRRFYPFTQYNGFAGLSNALVLDIVDGDGGRKWICSNAGLYEYYPQHGILARYSSADTGSYYIPTASVQHLHRDAQGIYWLASTDGLIRWDKARGTHRVFTTEDGLSSNNLYAIYEDSLDRLWLSSAYGIMEFGKESHRVKTYLIEDGVSYNEFNRISHTRDSSGTIYFGSLNGVTAFHPRDFPPESNDAGSAPLSLSSFEQFDGTSGRLVERTAELTRGTSITLEPGDRFFTLEFALLAYDDAAHTAYFWKIDGIDSGWNALEEPTLRVSGLPYGEKTLRIKALQSNGQWGANELVYRVSGLKPVYLRGWAITVAVLGIVAALFAAYRWRVYRLRKENERLDRLVKSKTAALESTVALLQTSSRQKDVLMKETHHRVKNNLQVVSTLLNLQLSKVSDAAARQSLEESASRISSIALVHAQLYEGDNLTAIELSDFVRRLLAQLSVVYGKPGGAVALDADIPETWFDIDTALPLGLILNELMTNSFKYAYIGRDGGRMAVSLVRDGDIFSLRYADDGPGLPDGAPVSGRNSLGMTIIHGLSKQLGGSFSYNSADRSFSIQFLDTETRKKIA